MVNSQTTEELYAAYKNAKAAFEANQTVESYEAAKAAWAAYDASGQCRKVSGYASRAGLRQARERRAMRAR